ncbi:MAG: zf-HC2 domain-containing protein [Chloroflexi bacterium]|nr:zf-HC2 domain-containing protein [Chloroflexota bacterium]MCI0855513.1 zf-HC2 domain-containing protein [Chloroflexota bacterium]MCI0890628.1 zf-HC2 domain-containing protein [Chloroflexota bacterium]
MFWRNRHEVREEELNALVDGELTESARHRIERHIESCTPCSEAVAELRGLSRAMSELPAVVAPRSFALREADIAAAKTPAPSSLFGSVQPLLSGVAAIAIVAFIVLVGVDIAEDNASDFDASTSGRMSTAVGERASLAPEVEDATVQEGDGSDDSFAAYGAGEEELATEDAAAPRAVGVPADGGDLPDRESDFNAVGDIDESTARGMALSPEEIAEEPPLGDSSEADGEGASTAVLARDDGDGTGLRVAESVAAAVAIAAGGSVLLIWWRRRATTG